MWWKIYLVDVMWWKIYLVDVMWWNRFKICFYNKKSILFNCDVSILHRFIHCALITI